jgi:hypothetical protein
MGFRLIGITAAVLGSGLLAGSVPMLAPKAALAQDAPVTFSAVRALNLARNTAVQLNGGLNVYRPAKCMFETAGAGNQCLISSSDGYQFRFLGGVPGWQQLDIAPSVETEIRISSDGKSVLGVDYNGAPR